MTVSQLAKAILQAGAAWDRLHNAQDKFEAALESASEETRRDAMQKAGLSYDATDRANEVFHGFGC